VHLENGTQEDAMQTDTPDPRRSWALALLCGAFFMVVLDAPRRRFRALGVNTTDKES
jgi:hypothetical protein